MPKVYVVQEPMRRDRETGVMERRMDLSPAAKYGELVFMLPGSRLPLQTDSWTPSLVKWLSGFTAEDYLLPVGDLTAIVAASAAAARSTNGIINVLRWERDMRGYVAQRVNVGGTDTVPYAFNVEGDFGD